MYEILFFFGAYHGNCFAITNTLKLNTERGIVSKNIKLVWQADSIIVFYKGSFHSVVKSRYKSINELSEEMKDKTLESVVSKLQHWNLSFIIDTELEILTRFSKPYTVYSILKDEYILLDHEAKMEKFNEIRTAI